MTNLETISWAALGGTLSFKSVYLLLWAFTFGSSVWVTFVGRNIVANSASKHEYHTLEKKVMPKYYQIVATSAAGLFLGWLYNHPDVLSNILLLKYSDVLQQHVLLLVILLQSANAYLLGPAFEKTASKKHHLEKKESKESSNTEKSAEKNPEAVHKELQTVDQTSTALAHVIKGVDYVAISALAFHGFWIANYGIAA